MATVKSDVEQAKILLARYRDSPTRFAEEVLRLRVWSGQDRIFRAIAAHDRVAVRSGHKIGKSKSAAAIAHWWVCTRQHGLVVMSAPTARQVEEILWREFRATYRGALVPLGPKPAIRPSTGYRLSDGRGVYGFSTKEPERMAGISGAEVLFIIDEASGFPEDIFEAIEGNRAGGGKQLLFSNPTQTSGTFFDAFHTKASFWERIHISSREAAELVPPISGLATKAWLAEKAEEWGEDSPIFKVRAQGDFPDQASNSVVALAAVDAAIKRWDDRRATSRDQLAELGPLEIGVDPARFGDDESVIVSRRGVRVLDIRTRQGLDGIQLAGAVLEAVRSLRSKGEKPRIKVDVIGIGASVFDQLQHFTDEVVPVSVNVAEVSEHEDKYGNLRDQVWFEMARWLDTGEIPDDGKLQGELVAPVYTFDPKGRQRVESKAEIKKRTKRSPDRADALCLAVHRGKTIKKITTTPSGEARRSMDGW